MDLTPVHEDLLAPEAGFYADTTGDPDGAYLYCLRAVCASAAERTLGETIYDGRAGGTPLLRLRGANPSSGEIEIAFRCGGAGSGEVAVYDAAGRRVRTLARSAHGRGDTGVLAWDGRDASGGRVASGLYWVRLIAGSRTETARLVVIR
jgi:hypothetical protein